MRAVGQRTKVPQRRYHIAGPQAIAVPAKTEVFLQPNHWEARKWRRAVTLPAGSLVPAVVTIPGFDPGHTFIVHENVRAGDPITLYSTRSIPKAKALIEKKNGNQHIYFHKSRMEYLDSRPFSGMSKEWMARRHEVGGHGQFIYQSQRKVR